jgi:phosphoglycolate phosphatase
MLTTGRERYAGGKGHWPAAVIFDLDGTLVDSVGDIASSINDLLAARCLPPFPEDQVRKFIGGGIDALVERAFYARGIVLRSEELRSAVESYEDIYGARLTESTRIYDGVVRIISELRARGVGIGICTNKLEDKAVGVIEGLGLRKYFDVVVGARRGCPAKPSPDPLFDTLERLGVDTADTIMVGDSVVDVQCARAAGVAIIGVSFGYSQTPMRELGPDATIDGYDEFGAACASLRARAS